MELRPTNRAWLEQLNPEDIAFIKRFILASGSLKGLAEDYGISYPTVRLRLDRLIDKIKILDDQAITSVFERTLRALYADGRLDADTLTQLLAAHQRDAKESTP